MISELSQWSATALTIASVYFYGKPLSKNIKGPILGLLSQIPWWMLMFVEDLWGLLIMNIFMLISHIFNLVRRLRF